MLYLYNMYIYTHIHTHIYIYDIFISDDDFCTLDEIDDRVYRIRNVVNLKVMGKDLII